ncbi:MAG: hypothetical protein KKC01_01810 [Gammaproteobacteria bacterium]|nr:hypothetical protein [Gammaproteobacteria bacterium]
MNIDEEKIDQVVLALLWLNLHDGCRVWKSFDWDAMQRLHGNGYISNPASKAKSVQLTGPGMQAAERLFKHWFSSDGA